MKVQTKDGKIVGAFLLDVVKYKNVNYISGNEYHGLVELYDHNGKLAHIVKRTKRGFRKT